MTVLGAVLVTAGATTAALLALLRHVPAVRDLIGLDAIHAEIRRPS